MITLLGRGVFIGVVFFGLTMPAQAAEVVGVIASSSVVQASVEERVREYFADIPVMAEIARCESKFRQFTDSGNVLRGGVDGGMIGVFQFFEAVHANAALGLGFDLATLEGNLGYARHLYVQQGTTPWDSAAACWQVSSIISAPASERELQITLLESVIGLLRQLLLVQLASR